MGTRSGGRITIEHDRTQVRAMAHLVITLCTASDPVTRKVLKTHAPEFGALSDALAGAETVRAALLAAELGVDELDLEEAAGDLAPA